MPKKEKKTREEGDMTISRETQLKWNRAIERQRRLEAGNNFIRTGSHRTAKKDLSEDQSNTLSEIDLAEIIEEEYDGEEFPYECEICGDSDC